MTERTKMECIRCRGFSSARICWSCSQRTDAIDYALVESLNLQLSEKEIALCNALASLQLMTCERDDLNAEVAKLSSIETELRAFMRGQGYGHDSHVDTCIWSFFKNRAHSSPQNTIFPDVKPGTVVTARIPEGYRKGTDFWCTDVARFGSGDCTKQCDNCRDHVNPKWGSV